MTEDELRQRNSAGTDERRLHVANLDPWAVNVAEQMTRDQRGFLAGDLVRQYEEDLSSCSDRHRKMAFWREQFASVPRHSDRPDWSCTAHLPTATVPSMQFGSRADAYLMPRKGLVKCMSSSNSQEEAERAERVRRSMHEQIEYQMGLEGEDPREVLSLANTQTSIDGEAILKARWNGKCPEWTCIPAEDLVLSYTHSGPLESAARVTHRLRMTRDQIRQRVQDGLYLQEGWRLDGHPLSPTGPLEESRQKTDGVSPPAQPADTWSARDVLEMYVLLDLNGDGIGEPWICTVDRQSKTLLRVVNRKIRRQVGEQSMETPEGMVSTAAYIEEDYFPFVRWPFSFNPTGFYGLGNGHLLEGITIVIDGLVQQQLDAGRKAVFPPKLCLKRAFKSTGEHEYTPDGWIEVDGAVEELDKAIKIVPEPGPHPSQMNLTSLLLREAQRFGASGDVQQGIQSQDTPPSATTELIQSRNSLVVFTSVFQRLWRCMAKLLQKTATLNRYFLDDATYNGLLGECGDAQWRAWTQAKLAWMEFQAQLPMMLQQAAMQGIPPELALAQLQQAAPPEPPEYPYSVLEDFAPSLRVYPVADPDSTSDTEKQQLAQAAFQTVMQNPALPPSPPIAYAVTKRLLEAMKVPNVDEILQPPPPPPQPVDLPQELEIADLLEGKPMFVLPDQDHTEHLRVIAQYQQENNGWWLEQLRPEQREALLQHQREHMAGLVRLRFAAEQASAQGVLGAPAAPPAAQTAGPLPMGGPLGGPGVPLPAGGGVPGEGGTPQARGAETRLVGAPG